MSKRLKRRIREFCGFDSLSKDERIKRAKEILNDSVEKQAICNDILGASFKDVEKVMKDAIEERRPSKHQQEFQELVEEVPEKVYPEQHMHQRSSTPVTVAYLLDKDEVAALVNESKVSLAEVAAATTWPPENNKPYNMEEVAALIEGNYHPDMFKYTKSRR